MELNATVRQISSSMASLVMFDLTMVGSTAGLRLLALANYWRRTVFTICQFLLTISDGTVASNSD